jgi:type II secretory pathway pseudopilin PulG
MSRPMLMSPQSPREPLRLLSPRPLLRAYSLLEVALTFVLLAAVLAVVAPRLLSGDSAAAAREAQVSLESAAASARSLASYNGGPSADLSLYAELTPRLAFVDSNTDSTAPSMVSLGVLDFSVMVAASDAKGVCWGLIETLEGSGLASVYVAFESAECSASLLLPLVGDLPPEGSGRAWSDPWVQ